MLSYSFSFIERSLWVDLLESSLANTVLSWGVSTVCVYNCILSSQKNLPFSSTYRHPNVHIFAATNVFCLTWAWIFYPGICWCTISWHDEIISLHYLHVLSYSQLFIVNSFWADKFESSFADPFLSSWCTVGMCRYVAIIKINIFTFIFYIPASKCSHFCY